MNHPAAQLDNQASCDSPASPSNTEPCEQQPLEQQSLKQQSREQQSREQQSREQQLHTWLTQVFPNQLLQHEKIPGDASFRSYHRLIVDNQHYIVMDAPPEKESVKEFIAVDNLMAGHVHVPKMIATDEQQGFIVLEDLGNTDFADVIAKDLTDAGELVKTARYYQQAMQAILAIQKIDINDAKAVIPSYDDALLRREMGLFSEWFLPYIGVTMTPDLETLWQDLQSDIIQKVIAQPQVVVHRDFHSRNLMVLSHSDELGVIDFQDAVIGAYTYDLASLLRDAYINYDETWVNTHLAHYHQLAQIDKSLADFTMEFNVMSMQRHLKVLGIFVRLFERDGKARYLANLSKVFNDLLNCLKAITEWGERNNFDKFDDWLTAEVEPAFIKKLQG